MKTIGQIIELKERKVEVVIAKIIEEYRNSNNPDEEYYKVIVDTAGNEFRVDYSNFLGGDDNWNKIKPGSTLVFLVYEKWGGFWLKEGGD